MQHAVRHEAGQSHFRSGNLAALCHAVGVAEEASGAADRRRARHAEGVQIFILDAARVEQAATHVHVSAIRGPCAVHDAQGSARDGERGAVPDVKRTGVSFHDARHLVHLRHACAAVREVVLLHEQTAELVRHVHGRRKCHAGVPVGVVGGHDAVVRRVGRRADNRAADRNQIAVSGELEFPVRRQADDAVGVEDGIGTLCHQREIALDVDVRRRHVRHGPEVAVAVDEEGGAFGVLQHVHPAGEGAFRHIGAASILQIGMGRAVGGNGHAAVAGAAFKQHAHELVPLRDPSARS